MPAALIDADGLLRGRLSASPKLDDSSFPTPIYANLVEVEGSEGSHALIWSRRNGD